MRTIFRNAANRIVFELRDDPARISDAAAVFRQGGRTVLVKGKDEITIRAKTDGNALPFWEAGILLTPEESGRFDERGLGFVQLVVLRDSGVQDPGEIYEFDVCSSLAERVRFDPAQRRMWKGESKEGGA